LSFREEVRIRYFSQFRTSLRDTSTRRTVRRMPISSPSI
jgi:hypothetical protein